MAIESDQAGTPVFEPGHCPRSKNIAGSKDGLGENNCFSRICAIVADLPVDGAVCQGQWDGTSFCAAVVKGDFGVECYCDWERLDVDSVNEEVEVVGEANVGAPVNEGERVLDPNGQPVVVAKSKDTWAAFDVNNTV
jgi:hypothetical protein